MLDQLQKCVADEILPESHSHLRNAQHDFLCMAVARKVCGISNGTLSVCIDLTKAFDTVNQSALWEILKRFGCPEKILTILNSFITT